jgi:hypothetical protein
MRRHIGYLAAVLIMLGGCYEFTPRVCTDGAKPAGNVALLSGGRLRALGSGFDSTVTGLALDATSGRIYAAGAFTMSGGRSVPGIASWDPETAQWEPVGGGLRGEIKGVATSGHEVIAYGDIEGFGGVAIWDGIQWSSVEYFRHGVVHDVVAGHGEVCVAGWRPESDQEELTMLDLESNQVKPVAMANDEIRTLIVTDTVLYAGGSFTRIGGEPISYLALLNRSTGSWRGADGIRASGSQYLPSRVDAIALAGNDLYAFGEFQIYYSLSNRFSSSGRYTVQSNVWYPLPGAPLGGMAITVKDGALVVGGSFGVLGGSAEASNLARYDLQTSLWSSGGGGVCASSSTHSRVSALLDSPSASS